MIFSIDSEGGIISLGWFAVVWGNKIDGLPGFTALSFGDVNLEFGEIDSGNGIHLTTFKDGDIDIQRTLVNL